MKKLTLPFTALFAIGALSLTGCPPQSTETTDDSGPAPTADAGDDGDDGGHSHGAGPHGGAVADWGGGAYHVEFTVSHDDKEATIYILGDDEKTPAPIDADEIQLTIKDPEMEVTLKAMPEEGEDKASKFVGNHESLGVVQEYEGTITGVVDGTPYTGDFKEVAE